MSNSIGKNLKVMRITANFSQDQISGFLGINRSTYSNYESGGRQTPSEVIQSLSNLYGCDAYDFYSDDITQVNGIVATAFRISDLSTDDMKEVAKFKEFVRTYIDMFNLLEDEGK